MTAGSRAESDYDVDALLARWDADVHLARAGVGFLMHGLLDSVVDGRCRTVEQLVDLIDDLKAARDPMSSVLLRHRGWL